MCGCLICKIDAGSKSQSITLTSCLSFSSSLGHPQPRSRPLQRPFPQLLQIPLHQPLQVTRFLSTTHHLSRGVASIAKRSPNLLPSNSTSSRTAPTLMNGAPLAPTLMTAAPLATPYLQGPWSLFQRPGPWLPLGKCFRTVYLVSAGVLLQSPHLK